MLACHRENRTTTPPAARMGTSIAQPCLAGLDVQRGGILLHVSNLRVRRDNTWGERRSIVKSNCVSQLAAITE